MKTNDLFCEERLMNMRWLVRGILTGLFLIFLSVSFVHPAMGKGTIELGGNVYYISSWFSQDGNLLSSVNYFLITPRVGFSKTGIIEIEPELILGRAGDDNPDFSYIFGGIMNFDYNFKTSGSIKPFLFAGTGFLRYSSERRGNIKTSLILPDLGGGARIFMTEKSALRLEVFYQNMSNYLGYEGLNATNFGFRGGFSVFLK